MSPKNQSASSSLTRHSSLSRPPVLLVANRQPEELKRPLHGSGRGVRLSLPAPTNRPLDLAADIGQLLDQAETAPAARGKFLMNVAHGVISWFTSAIRSRTIVMGYFSRRPRR